MNICVVAQQFNVTISGIGLHSNNLVRRLLADGHAVWLIVPEQVESFHPKLTIISINPSRLKNQARWLSIAWKNRQALLKLQKNIKLDIIHFTDGRESLFFSSEVPVIGNINDTYSAELHSIGYYKTHYRDWLTRWTYYHIVHFFEGIALRKLDKVIANSIYTAKIIGSVYKVKPNRLVVIHKSIDLSRYNQYFQEKPQSGGKRILFVGSNMQRKGLPILIRASAIVSQHCSNVVYWVVGDDPAQSHMEKLCKEYKVEDHFRFLGWRSQDELLETYHQCQILVLPALTEAFGVVILEAMASELAVIASNVGGIPEIIKNGINGILINPGSPTDLAKELIRLIQNDKLRSDLVEHSKKDVRQFDISHMMDKTYQQYKNLIHEAKHEDGVH